MKRNTQPMLPDFDNKYNQSLSDLSEPARVRIIKNNNIILSLLENIINAKSVQLYKQM